MDAMTYLESQGGWGNVSADPAVVQHTAGDTCDPGWTPPFTGGFLTSDCRFFAPQTLLCLADTPFGAALAS